jgi:hypothetical protein
VDEILEWAHSPFGQRILETIPIVWYYPFRNAFERVADIFTARIQELEARVRELEAEED